MPAGVSVCEWQRVQPPVHTPQSHALPPEAEVRRLELLDKFQELKKKGDLTKFMEKRRKKSTQKYHKYLPHHRRATNGE